MSPVTFIVGIVIGMAAKQPVFTALFVMLFSVVLGGMVFSTHEKNHTEKLYGTLPLTKREMIVGRYLYALIIGAVSIVIAGALSKAVSIFIDTPVEPVLYWGALAGAFVYYCFAVGVSFPIFFKFGFAKANVFTMLPMYLLVIAFMLLTRKTNFTSDLNQFIQFFSDNQYLVPILGIIGGVILLAISATIANVIYIRKET
jgi:ABC-type transport system involved in multi-copper enzyme maturation permease subunit